MTARTRERGYGGAAKERKNPRRDGRLHQKGVKKRETREGRTTAEENLGETKELG